MQLLLLAVLAVEAMVVVVERAVLRGVGLLHKTLALLRQVEMVLMAVTLALEMYLQAVVVQVFHLKQGAQAVVVQVLALA
jgi:hypothetical protein